MRPETTKAVGMVLFGVGIATDAAAGMVSLSLSGIIFGVGMIALGAIVYSLGSIS